MSVEMKTPDEWLRTPDFFGVTVIDPDGWDRSNLKESWSTPISLEEFKLRLSECTCRWTSDAFAALSR